MTRRTSPLLFALALGVTSLFSLRAQSATLNFAGIDPEVNFGRPSNNKSDIWSPLYLRTDATLTASGRNVTSAGQGVPLFVQKEGSLAGSFPSGLAGFAAVAHNDGFVSIYAAKDFRPELTADTEVAKGDIVGRTGTADKDFEPIYHLRVFDGASRLWVNPAFFLQEFQDRAAPKIEEIALLGEARSYTAENRKNFTQQIRQGDYRLAVKVMDPPYSKGSVSGVFRFKVVLDGNLIADRKFDSAGIADKGLVFLGLAAPSSSIVDDGGRFVLGGQFIPRGLHSLEFSAYDYAGNSSSFTWKFMAQ
ncbi:MAG: hypothetical protein CVV53_06535 [Spirochaetae bacterium HGW-Spirochaetae-9]|nr:MAG: hypothetical protein CVV53_06535 [Spirochaetae bacterium HGW-Spirochaetae-9]